MRDKLRSSTAETLPIISELKKVSVQLPHVAGVSLSGLVCDTRIRTDQVPSTLLLLL